MNKGADTVLKVIDKTIGDFMNLNSDLRQLFNENSNSQEMVKFFLGNFDDIYNVVDRLLYENKEKPFWSEDIGAECLRTVKEDYELLKQSLKLKGKGQLKQYQKRMIVATMIYFLVREDYAVEDLLIDNVHFINNDGHHWYRGQSNYNWLLIPSMFRNLDNVFSRDTIVDKKAIEQIYSDNGMLKKWEQVFKNSKVDYAFLSYMQHSIEYSPLLDFTSDFPSALSFSLSNRRCVNDFAYIDSAVFQIEVKENRMLNTKGGDLPPGFSITFLPNAYVIGAPVLGKPMRTYSDIIKALTPDFVMIDEVNNDRMRYQNGKFIFFYNYLSIQGTVFTWLNKDLNITKLRIRKEDKNKWCEKLRRDYQYLTVDKMMNPYSYFSDQ